MEDYKELTINDLACINGGGVNWGVAAGYCVAGALIGAAGGAISAGVGCLVSGLQEVSDGIFK